MSILSNPIFRQNLISRMRPQRLLVITVAYLAFISLIFILTVLGYTAGTAGPLDVPSVCKTVHLSLLILQFAIYWIVGLSLCSASVVRERNERTIEFFETLPLSYRDMVIGKLTGPCVLLHYLQLITVPIVVLTGLVGHVSLMVMVKLYIVLVLGSLWLNALGLVASTLTKKQSSINLFVLLTVILSLVVPCIGITAYERCSANYISLLSPVTHFIHWFAPYYGEAGFNSQISFFGFELPVLGYTCLVYLCLAAIFLNAAVRKFRDEEAQIFSPGKGMLLFIIFVIGLVGFMPDALLSVRREHMVNFSIFFQLSWFVLLCLGLFLTPGCASLFAWVRGPADRGLPRLRRFLTGSESPILKTGIAGFAVMTAVGCAACAYLPPPYVIDLAAAGKMAVGLGILLGHLLLYLLLAQYATLASREKGLALGMVMVLVLYLLPLIVAAVGQDEMLMVFNPTAGTYVSGAFKDARELGDGWLVGLAYPYAFSLVLGMMIAGKLRQLGRMARVPR